MTELEFALIKILSKNNLSPNQDGISLNDAQIILNNQYLLYESMFKKFSFFPRGLSYTRMPTKIYENIVNDIKVYFETHLIKVAKMRPPNTGNRLLSLSELPILDQIDVELVSSIIDSEQFKRSIHEMNRLRQLVISALRMELELRSWGGNMLPSINNSEFTLFDAKYISLRELYLESENTNSNLVSVANSYRSGLVKEQQRFELFNDEFNKRTDALSVNIVNLESTIKEGGEKYNSLVENISKSNKKLNDIVTESQTSITNYEKSVTEFLKTSILGKFWLNRARWATAALCFSIFIICGLFVGATWAVFHFSDDIKGLITLKDLTEVEAVVLKDNISGVVAFQLTRAFLLAVPVILYFWIIKLAVRFFMRSLLLMDDARQRNVIMQSYVQMVREGAVDDKALAIIMWALCRSVPGHGPDGIEPPDFTEVLRAGSSLGKNPS